MRTRGHRPHFEPEREYDKVGCEGEDCEGVGDHCGQALLGLTEQVLDLGLA